MAPLTDQERELAETAARVIEVAATIGLPDPPDKLGITPLAMSLITRAYIELRRKIRSLHDLVDLTDPNDPIGVALTKADLARRPSDPQKHGDGSEGRELHR